MEQFIRKIGACSPLTKTWFSWLFPYNLFAMSSNKNLLKISRRGIPHNFLQDFYHSLMRMNWLQFSLLFSFTYLLINSFFASLYYLGGDSILNADPLNYWEAFLFSFQTSTTIGYGFYLPQTTLAHIIVIFDSISGILFVAIATGMAFSRFSRPTARVLFSKNLVISNINGKRTLMFRMGNARHSQIIDAQVKVVMTRPEVTTEGQSMRRIYDLQLVRSSSPLFSLSWTVMHEITPESPLYEMEEKVLMSREINFIISMTGIDDVFSQTIYDRYMYWGDSLLLGKRFVDVMGIESNGEAYIDYNCFHKVKDASTST